MAAPSAPPIAPPLALATGPKHAFLPTQGNQGQALRELSRRSTVSESPQNVRAQNERIVSLFSHFRTQILGTSLSEPFTTEHVVRFLEALRTKMLLPIAKGVPNVKTLQQIHSTIRKYGLIAYPDVQVTASDKAITQAYFENLLAKDRATLGSYFDKNWFTFGVVSRMGATWLQYHLVHGSPSWDLTVVKLLGVVLQSALGCKSPCRGTTRRSTFGTETWSSIWTTL